MNKIIVFICSFLLSNFVLAGNLSRSEEINLLNKIGYGVTTKDLNYLDKIGYDAWIEEQLNITEKEKTLTQEELFKEFKKNDLYYNQIMLDKPFDSNNSIKMVKKQLEIRMRNAIFSHNRIQEMMLWFWYNHFNTGVKTNTTPLTFLYNYEIKLKNNALGQFKDLLKIVSSDPSMLTYLNNIDNRYTTNGIYHLNENYAREFLELHTMGVNSGYTQEDVQELTKVLSGHTHFTFFDLEKYKIENYSDFVKYSKKECKNNFIYKDFYMFCSDNHFQGEKIFLNHKIINNNEKELDEVINIIVNNEETAKFISKKLYVYFVEDTPNSNIIFKMSQKFQETNGSIKDVLRVLFLSEEFKNSLKKPTKVKDTYSYIVSILKTDFNEEFLKNTPEVIDDAANFLMVISGTPYDKNTPDGLSMIGEDWLSSARLQEYIYFNEDLFNKFLEPSKKEINYDLISEIKGENLEKRKQVVEFNLSEKWIKK